jgi:Flp pilus assembly protein TadD
MRLGLFVGLLLIVATLVPYSQVVNHQFINYDDRDYVTQNQHVQKGLTLESLVWAFTNTHAANWHPLTWLSHMLDCELYGLSPAGHHITNVLLHIANAILLFMVLRRMTGTLWNSAFVAALFALHPLHVESVAWVSERKDVLSTLFWMLTLWFYVGYVRRPVLWRYLVVLLTFAIGLMAKPMLVTLPFVLLLLDYWPLGRWKPDLLPSVNTVPQKPATTRPIWEKLPFLVLSALSCVMTVIAQRGALAPVEHVSIQMRIANALVSYVKYLEKTVWPNKLAIYYPYPSNLSVYQVIGSSILILLISFLVLRVVRRHPYFAVGWFWYLGTLVPVIGLVQVGSQAIADRYSYVPLVGISIAIAWGIPAMIRTSWRHKPMFLAGTAVLLLLCGLIRSWFQLSHWENSTAIFKHTIEVTTDNFVAHDSLGLAMSQQGNLEEAMAQYREALRIKPNYSKAHINLGTTLALLGRRDEAFKHFSEGLRYNPQSAEAHYNLGLIYAGTGDLDSGIIHFREALRIRPDYAKAHNNLGMAHLMRGDLSEAIDHFSMAVKIKPGYEEANRNLEMANRILGRL